LNPDLFRLTLPRIIRRFRSLPWFRDPKLAIVELDDPVRPGESFFSIGTLRALEVEYNFRRDRVPAYLRVFIGRGARNRIISKLREIYNLDIIERVAQLSQVGAPVNDDPSYLCLIELPPGKPLFFGSRLTALVQPPLRELFFTDGAPVFHGVDAVERMREIINSSR
jgi:hypothetical protein